MSYAHAFPAPVATRTSVVRAAIVLACIAAASILAVMTGAHLLFYERVSSPGFLMNGSFAGRWVVDPADRHEISRLTSDRSRLEIRLTKDIALSHFEQAPSVLAMPDGVLAEGTIAWGAKTSACEFLYAGTDPVGFQLRYTSADDPLPFGSDGYGDRVLLWLDAWRCPGQWSVRFPSKDVLYVSFGEDVQGVKYVRE